MLSLRFPALLCLLLALAGCGTAKKAAITTFRVVDAPARFVRDRIDPPVTTTTTTTTETSDVVNPGYPVAAATPTPPPQRTTTPTRRDTAGARQQQSGTTGSSAQTRPPTAAARPTPAPTNFPTARPVPGRPGFVYSLDPNGGIVDVNGYKPGDKAKDPYTKQIFIVP